MNDVEALAAALHEADWPPSASPRGYGDPAWSASLARVVLASLARSGWSLVRTQDLARLRTAADSDIHKPASIDHAELAQDGSQRDRFTAWWRSSADPSLWVKDEMARTLPGYPWGHEEYARTGAARLPGSLPLNESNGPWCGCGQPLGLHHRGRPARNRAMQVRSSRRPERHPGSTPTMTEPLRAALDKAIAVIDDPTRYIEVNQHYRAGWVDALTALRDDPALAADTARPGLDVDGAPFPAEAIYAALQRPDVLAAEAATSIGRIVIAHAFRAALREQGYDVCSLAARPTENRP